MRRRAWPWCRCWRQVQDDLIHLDQVVRVKTPAVDYRAISRDEIRRDQTPAIGHDHAERFQKREEIAGFSCLGSEANKRDLTGETSTETYQHDAGITTLSG